MNTLETTLLVIAVLAAAVAYGAYLVATIRGDGVNFSRRRPPASRHRDLFDPTRVA